MYYMYVVMATLASADGICTNIHLNIILYMCIILTVCVVSTKIPPDGIHKLMYSCMCNTILILYGVCPLKPLQ